MRCAQSSNKWLSYVLFLASLAPAFLTIVVAPCRASDTSTPDQPDLASQAAQMNAPDQNSQTSQADQTGDVDQSNQPLKNLTLEQLGDIEVTTASKEPVEVWQTPAAIYVITHDDIMRSGATSIPEALRLAPGVEVARIDGNKWSIGIRGFGTRLSRSVLVIIDGRTVYSTLFDGTYWEVQNVMMDDIDRIEVIRGPGGTIWGPNAVNGVINVITKAAHDTRGALVSSGGGNEEQGFLNARYGGSNGKGLDYRFYGMGFNRGAEYHTDGHNFDSWKAGQAGFRVDWAESHRDSFTFQGDMYDEAAGESVQATSYTPPYSQIIDADARLSGGNILARWKRITGEGNDIQVQGYYDRTNRYEPNFGELRDTYDLDYLERHRLPWRQQLSWGAGMRFSRGHELEVVSGLTFVPAIRTDELFSLFFQDDVALVPRRLSLEAGSKVIRTNYTGFQWQPSVRLLWTPTETQTFWLGFTHAVRTPSDVERDFYLSGYEGMLPNGMQFFARFNANPNFGSEQMNGYELGYRRLIGPKVYVDFAAFYNHYHDLLSEEITGAPYIETTPTLTYLLLPAQFRNGLLGSTTGAEIAPEWRPTTFWRLRGSYSYLRMALTRAPGSMDVGTAPIIAGSSPAHQVAIQSGFDISKAFTLDLDFRYVSALPGQMVRAYNTGDANFGWRVNRQLQLSFVGLNLFQPHHAEDGGDPGPLVQIKRSAYAKLTWTR
jgi:iron complex outermembrane recepter protein